MCPSAAGHYDGGGPALVRERRPRTAYVKGLPLCPSEAGHYDGGGLALPEMIRFPDFET